MRRPKMFDLLVATFVVVNALLLTALGAGFVGVTYLSGNESRLIQRNLPVVEQARQFAALSETIGQALLDVEQAESPERLRAAVRTLADHVRTAETRRDALRDLDGESEPLARLTSSLERLRGRIASFETRAERILSLTQAAAENRRRAESAFHDLAALSSAAIANTQAEISSGLSGLYEQLDQAARERILDKLAESDLFKIQSFLELREALERAAARLEAAFAAAEPEGVTRLEAGFDEDLKLARRRAAFMENPARRAEALDRIAALEAGAGASGALRQRRDILTARQELSGQNRDALIEANDIATAARDVMRASERDMVALQKSSVDIVWTSLALFSVLGLLALAALAWSALFVRRRVILRLRRLLDRLVTLGRGETQWEIPISGADDIGQMEAALGAVRDEVKRKQKLETQLQAEVAQRTSLYKAEMVAHDKARAEAEQATRAKAEFLAIMSHEIRTPLNGLTGMLRLLSTQDDSENRKRLDLARRSASDLTRLLDDILEHAKVELGNPDLHVADFETRDLVRRVADQMTPLAAAKGLLFLGDIDPRLPPALLGDRGKIQQILVNLCSNAIKFTDRGEVSLHVDALGEGADGLLRVRFRVDDTGIGMNREVLARVFEAFEQGHSPVDPRAVGGTGLGLAICRSLTLRLGGSLTVDSEPGLGSSFALTLDMAVGDLSRALEGDAAPESAGPAMSPFQVLLVEDHDVSRLVAREYLERLGGEVAEVATGVDAVAQAEQGAFDVILMDLDLPDLTGVETARRIRRLAAHRATPVVAVSAHVSTGPTQAAEGFAFAALLPKPLSPAALARTLREVGVATPTPMSAQHVAALANDDPVRAALDQDVDLLGAQKTSEILTAFARQLAQDVDALADALAGADMSLMQKRAHRLRGAAANYALQDLVALAQAIEADPGARDAKTVESVRKASQDGLRRLKDAATRRGLDLPLA